MTVAATALERYRAWSRGEAVPGPVLTEIAAEADALAEAIKAALAIHKSTDYAFDTSGVTTEDDAPFCAECQTYDEWQNEWRPAAWPCATARALGVTE